MRALIRVVGAGTLFVASGFLGVSYAQTPQVALTGVAYSGDAQAISARFPSSNRLEQALKQAGELSFSRVKAAIAQTSPQGLEVQYGQLDELKGRDQSLVVSLIDNSETVSVE